MNNQSASGSLENQAFIIAQGIMGRDSSGPQAMAIEAITIIMTAIYELYVVKFPQNFYN